MNGINFNNANNYFSSEISARLENQQDRIEQGINNGSLTAGEIAHLETRDAKIENNLANAESNGHISLKEFASINRELNGASSNIYQDKHNFVGNNPYTPFIHARQENQQDRIAQGIDSGALTAKEATRLEAGEAAFQQDLHQAKADGNVTPAERQQLHQDLNQLSQDIYQAKHNCVRA